MNLTVRKRAKICTMLTMAVAGIVLAGCGGDPATSTAGQGQGSSGVTLVDRAGCVARLTVGWADNGTTRCLQLHGQVSVVVRAPGGSWYDAGFDVSGSSLEAAVTPGWATSHDYVAVASGTTVISMPQPPCLGGHACMTLPAWSVTIVVP